MSERARHSNSDAQESAGCLLFVGVGIMSLAIGAIFGAPVGWLALGISFCVIAILAGANR